MNLFQPRGISSNCLFFVVFADMTERDVQECFRVGIGAEFGALNSVNKTGIDGHFARCSKNPTKNDGLCSLFFQLTLTDKACMLEGFSSLS